ncbi:MAG: TIGR01459 family HAD-type hydrolase [Pseudomonadota bacterium]
MAETALSRIDHLSDVTGAYGGVLCDAWGVIHDGRAVFPGVEEALTQFRRTHGPVIVLTNAPKPAALIPGQLDRLGLSRQAYDGVVTSGDVTRHEITERPGKKACFIGWGSDDALFRDLPIEFGDVENADYILCTGLRDDGPHDPEGYLPLLEQAASRGLEFVCANPDIVVRWKGELMWCAGAIAREYEKLGGKVIYAGKPYGPVYDLAKAAIAKAKGEPVSPAQLLAIGDGAGTDILGATQAGIDAIYVTGAGGVHVPADEANNQTEGQRIAEVLRDHGARAIGYTEGLNW